MYNPSNTFKMNYAIQHKKDGWRGVDHMDTEKNERNDSNKQLSSDYQKQLIRAVKFIDDKVDKENMSISTALDFYNERYPHASIVRPRYYDAKKYINLTNLGFETSLWGALKLHKKINKSSINEGISFDEAAKNELQKNEVCVATKVADTLFSDFVIIRPYLKKSPKLKSGIFIDFLPPNIASKGHIAQLWLAMHLVAWAPDRLNNDQLLSASFVNIEQSKAQTDFYHSLKESSGNGSILSRFLNSTIYVLKKHSGITISEFEILHALLNTVTSHCRIELIIKKINEGNINEL